MNGAFTESVNNLVRISMPTNTGPTVTLADDIRLEAGPPALIRGFVDAGSLSAVYAPPAAGKSWIATDILAAIASGTRWRGQSKAMPPLPVAYLPLEGIRGAKRRIYGLRQRGILRPEARFYLLEVPTFNLLDEVTVSAVIDALESIGPAIVCIDTWACAIAGADENAVADTNEALGQVRRIMAELNTAAMIVHHAGKDASKGMRGSSALLGAMDTVLSVERTEGGEIVVYSQKQRDLEAHPPVAARLTPFDLGTDAEGEVIRSAYLAWLPDAEAAELSGGAVVNVRTMQKTMELADAVRKCGGPGFATVAAIAAETGKAETTVRGWLRDSLAFRTAGGLILEAAE